MTIETARDIAIIILALLSMVEVILIIVLLYIGIRLALYVRGRVPPIFESAERTAHTVEATASTVGDNVVKPVIATASFVIGVRQFFNTLTKGFRKGEARHE